MRCEQFIRTGPREGQQCRFHATVIILGSGTPACGTHARAYVPRGLARIAYWSEKQRAWL